VKILFLSYYLNAENNVGAIRASKFIKYLQRMGHELYVFSSENGELECEKLQIKPMKNKGGSKFYQVSDNNSKIQKILLQLKVLIKDIIFSPDKQIWWNISILPKMISTIKKHDIDIAITTGSPFSTFISLSILKKLCGIPIILDFRDPWKDSITMKKQSFVRKINVRFWEKFCVKNADGIISVNNSIADKIKSYKPKGTVQTITNGFDPEDFTSNEHIDNEEEFTFLYTGKYSVLREDYDPRTVFEAFKKFKLSKPNKSILRFIGPTDQETLDFSNDYKQFGVICERAKPKHEIIKIQNKANVFIHFYHPHNYDAAISLKIYEYAYQNKLILSFNEKKGMLYNFLKEHGFGYTASSNELNDMVNLFNKALYNNLSFNPVKNIAEIGKYNYKSLTIDLENVMQSLVKGE